MLLIVLLHKEVVIYLLLLNLIYYHLLIILFYFLEKLDAYKEAHKPIEPPKEIVEEKNIIQKIIDFYTENIIFTVPITIIAVALIIFVIVRKIVRKKNRVKIDFDFKV